MSKSLNTLSNVKNLRSGVTIKNLKTVVKYEKV